MPKKPRGRRPRDRAERSYSRLDRVGSAVSEVVADELAIIEDERLELVSVTGARVEPGLRHGIVWFSALLVSDQEAVTEAFAEHRPRLQAALGRQLHLRRTPELSFVPDPAIEKGTRVEEIIRELHDGDRDATDIRDDRLR
ncbi:MAG: 30S ribosome-binding factor RbfA [Acidimicrobiales bacterium]